MSAAIEQKVPEESPLVTFFHISRFHIIVIAAAASLTFSWVFTGEHNLAVPALVAFDWFLVNILNRVVDLREDRLNNAVGTGFIDQNAKAITIGSWAALFLSFPLLHIFFPALLGWRILFQLIGIAYNYKIIPWPGGFTRFKEIYFFKNFASGVLFLLSGLVYPIVDAGAAELISPTRLALFAVFYLAMDFTYEIFYDLRDLDGDKAEGVPTFPVVHGKTGAHRLVIALLFVAAAALLGGYGLGALVFADVVMVAAVFQQGAYFKWKVTNGLNQDDCVFVTYLGAAQLVSYNLWIWAGLPLDLTTVI